MSWVYKKGTAWKTKLDKNIKWLKYTGVIEQWYKMELQHLDVGKKRRGRGKGVSDDPDTTEGLLHCRLSPSKDTPENVLLFLSNSFCSSSFSTGFLAPSLLPPDSLTPST
ncbi:hypothetical protein Pmani_009231 [Petrolisthes manimaculis]|uniref:Uncharacterized protein n=1 Tax=Petrolisthes manimaculis TaxID=1843537 RepID=A0AAE1Q594_9EUCA|nr:hypothetical protein Pmani_009231 [Petrolisthes manimaculis]